MEDMAWVPYALLGTQVMLLVLIALLGGAVVGELRMLKDEMVTVTLQLARGLGDR